MASKSAAKPAMAVMAPKAVPARPAQQSRAKAKSQPAAKPAQSPKGAEPPAEAPAAAGAALADQLAAISAKLDALLAKPRPSSTTTPPTAPVDTSAPSPISNVNPQSAGGLQGPNPIKQS